MRERFVIQARVSEHSASRYPCYEDYQVAWEGEPYEAFDEIAALVKLSAVIAYRLAHLVKEFEPK